MQSPQAQTIPRGTNYAAGLDLKCHEGHERNGSTRAARWSIVAAAVIVAIIVMFGTVSTSTASTASDQTNTITATAANSYHAGQCSPACTLNINWVEDAPAYPTLKALANSSELIVLGNITASRASFSGGFLVTLYDVSIVNPIKAPAGLDTVGAVFQFGQVGGSASNETMVLGGYPSLHIGQIYVLFAEPSGGELSLPSDDVIGNAPPIPFAPVVNQASGLAQPFISLGGPQGLFYIANGSVYSLDNMFPNSDGWLPLKLDSVPLADFVNEVYVALGEPAPTTISTVTPSVSISSTTAIRTPQGSQHQEGSVYLALGIAAVLAIALGAFVARKAMKAGRPSKRVLPAFSQLKQGYAAVVTVVPRSWSLW